MNASIHDFLNGPDTPQDAGPRRPQVSAAQKVRTLRELAAFQLTHGAIQWANDLIRIALLIDPDDLRSQRIQAHTLARLGKPMEALKLLLDVKRRDRDAVQIEDFVTVGLSLVRGGEVYHAKNILVRRRARSD